MHIFVPANNKGGVGKTSTSSLFAEYACKYLKKRVLGLDLDPQCNFSQRYLDMKTDDTFADGWVPPVHPDYDPIIDADWKDGVSTIADTFYGQEVIPYPTSIENFEICPGHAKKLTEAELVKKKNVAELVHERITEFLAYPEVRKSYDLVVIDTAPSKGPLTRSAIRAATHLIIPCVMEDKPIKGAYGMINLWMSESISRDEDVPLSLLGILPNLYDGKTALHKEYLKSLLEHEHMGKYVMPLTIGKRIAFAEVDSGDFLVKSVFDLPDKNKAKQEALNACELIAERVFA